MGEMTPGDRLFRACLRLLPEEFRAAYARDMEATFRAERHEARHTGRWAWLTRLWFATIADVLRRAPGQHRDILVRDLRFALRLMRVRPLHTTTAVLTLAIGIGANVAMFAVVDAVLLDPLAYQDPDAVVRVAETDRGADPGPIGFLTFVDLQNRSRRLSAIAAAAGSTLTLTGEGRHAERIGAMRVSRTYFDLVGVHPALGRPFTADEDRPGAARRVLILSDGLWRRRFDADPGVLDRALDIGGFTYRIVGVMPRGFEDLVADRVFGGVDAWTPLGYDPAASFACRTCRHLQVFGRLAPGVTPATAERELNQMFASLELEHPTQYHAAGAEVRRLSDVFLGPVRPVLLVLWVAVGLLLVVSCANVANLMLLRVSERSQEVAVRAALGVTRSRLARQLITEAILLGAIGAAAGLIPAWGAIRLVAIYGPDQIPRLMHAAFDTRAAAMAAVLAAVGGLVFGLVPLRQLLRKDFSSAVQGTGRRTESAATWRLRASLVIVNIAMAALLIVGSGLLVRSLVGLLTVSPGFDATNVLTMQVFAGGPAFRAGETPQQIATTVRFYDEVLTRVRALPGVTAASAVTTLPLGGNVDGYGFHIEGRLHANPQEAPSADRFIVSPEFFETLRVPLVRGRFLEPSDTQSTDAVAVINRTTAAELFPGEDPIGRRVMLGPADAPPRRIVGIVGDVRHRGLDVPVRYQVYAPQAQWAWAETWMALVIRSDRDPASLAAPVRDLLHAIDPAQPISNVRLYDDIVAGSTSARRFAANLLSVFALTTLVLAVIGLSGALGAIVGQRHREIGVRLALGARPARIARMVLEQGLRPAIIGVVIGLMAAAVSVGTIRTLLYRVDALSPSTYLTSAVVLMACAVMACLGPAIRASRIEPASALRSD
jgi:putative ABC transport system permease protein